MLMDTDDEQDEIVERGSVYISASLQENLRLLQFPAHSKPQPLNVKLKPKSQLTKFEFSLDEDEYDQDMAQELVGLESRERIDKLVLKSCVVPIVSKYFVGIMDGNDMHLTKLSGVDQMRPDLSYIDRRIEYEKDQKVKMNYEEMKEANPNLDEDAKAIQMNLRPADDIEGAKKADAADLRRKIESEEYKDLKVFLKSTTEAQDCIEKMLCDVEDEYLEPKANDLYIEKIISPLETNNGGFDPYSCLLQSSHLILGDKLRLIFLNGICC